MRRQPTGVAHPQLRLHHERFCWAGTGCCSGSDIFGFLFFFVVDDIREPEHRTGSAHEALTASGIIEQSAPSVNGRYFLSNLHYGASFSALPASPRQHCMAMDSESPSGEQVGSLHHRDPQSIADSENFDRQDGHIVFGAVWTAPAFDFFQQFVEYVFERTGSIAVDRIE